VSSVNFFKEEAKRSLLAYLITEVIGNDPEFIKSLDPNKLEIMLSINGKEFDGKPAIESIEKQLNDLIKERAKSLLNDFSAEIINKMGEVKTSLEIKFEKYLDTSTMIDIGDI
jgi:hypothetical protein